jgi:hypothetical protein
MVPSLSPADRSQEQLRAIRVSSRIFGNIWFETRFALMSMVG